VEQRRAEQSDRSVRWDSNQQRLVGPARRQGGRTRS
jgi:hypothetical protein